jgi:hypothetical protein
MDADIDAGDAADPPGPAQSHDPSFPFCHGGFRLPIRADGCSADHYGRPADDKHSALHLLGRAMLALLQKSSRDG